MRKNNKNKHSLLEHIKYTLMTLKSKGYMDSLITVDMFQWEDIDDVYTSKQGFSVSFKGINGVIPASFFDEQATEKILNYCNIKNSPLYKAMYESS